MKRISKLVCILLVVSFLFAIPVAANDMSTKASAFFVRHRTYLYEVQGNTFGVWFDVMATYRMDELGVSCIEIQRSTNQSTWTTVRTCYPSSYPQMIGTNTAIHADGVTYTGSSGYYYQAKVTYYAKSGNSEGTYTTYSDIIRLFSGICLYKSKFEDG